MIARVDERHVARGYDPYNSADQPHALRARKLKKLRFQIAEAAMTAPDHVLERTLPIALQACRGAGMHGTFFEIDESGRII